MKIKNAGLPNPVLPNLKVSATILVIVLLVLNFIPAAPVAATSATSRPTGMSDMAGDMSQPDHDMSKMSMPMPGMDMSGQSGSGRSGQAGLSAITLNSLSVTVDVSNFTFTPVTQTVTVGTTVNWNWLGGFHSVTSDTGLFNEPATLATGVNFSYTFTQPGTYYYHCAVHGAAGNGSQLGSGMAAVIIMVPPAPTITGLWPDTNMAGNPNFDLTVKGTNFSATSTLKFGTHSETVTFVNPTILIARIPAADFNSVATVPVVVTEGGQDTLPLNFEVTVGCTDRVVTKKTAGSTCGELRSALATSVGISFALLQNDTIDLGSGALVWPGTAVTMNGICASSGPAIKLDVSNIAGGFQVKAGATLNGLEILASGTNPYPVLSVVAPTGPNTFSCSKVTKL